jgi:hypothetical protein
MERLHLLNKLEQLRHVDWKLSIQLVFITHVEPIEPIATPIIVRQGIIYPQGTRPAISVSGLGERSQVPHHRLVSGGNQGVGIVTYSYCYQMGHVFNHYPFVDDRLR